MHDVLPRREIDLMRWARNFDQRLGAAPGPVGYGVTAEEAAAYAALLAEAEAAYEQANTPETRTSVVVAWKDEALSALRAMSRVLVKVIKARPSVTNEQRVLLGLAARRSARTTKIQRPEAMPVVRVDRVMGWRLELRLSDPDATGRRRLPTGVSGAAVMVYVGDQPPMSIEQWQYAGTTSKTRVALEVRPGLTPGTRVWYTARWLSPTYQPGPVASPTSVRVGFVGLEAAAGPRVGEQLRLAG